jgi:SHS2 domain-containing protein
MPYRIVEHTADVAVRLSGTSLPELVVALTAAFRRLVAGGHRLPAGAPTELVCSAAGPEGLLVAWGNELVFRFDKDGWLPSSVDDVVAEPLPGGDVRVRGRVAFCRPAGGGFRPVHDLKAATWHGLKVVRTRRGALAATLVFDT